MIELSENSYEIAKDRYMWDTENSWADIVCRVAYETSKNERTDSELWNENYKSIIGDMLFVPAGRILRNIGKLKPSTSNCNFLAVEDSIESIGNTLANYLTISSYGGGTGLNFSSLRPKDAPLKTKGGESSGMLSFLKIFDFAGKRIQTGGQRRSAGICILNIDHPEIFDFINAKTKHDQLKQFNISVGIYDSFLNAVEKDDNWEFKFAGRSYGKIKARELWDLILKNMLDHSEPGLINWDNLRKNNTYYFSPIEGVNPCFAGETRIITKNGYRQIKDLVGTVETIWDGDNWVECSNFRVTGLNQKMLKITLHDGSELRVTPYHRMILEDGTDKEAEDLQIGEKLEASINPLFHGNIRADGAYLKGFLVGDGHIKKERNHPCLYLYNTKYMCSERLLHSASQISLTSSRTNPVEDLGFNDEIKNRKSMRGIVARNNNELYKWCSDYKKRIPDEVFMWDAISKANFIAGVMDADGTAMDTKHGFGYQIWSIHKEWLLDFQTLLKSFGIYSKVSIGKQEEIKDFNDGYGEYESQQSYRLTISQANSIKLSSFISFERLSSFSDRETKYKVKNKFNTIVNIEDSGVDEEVYCCTVDSTHKLAISLGIQTGQCGELPLENLGVCNLGSLVLPNFIINKNTNWQKLSRVIKVAVRFLDNIIDLSYYPIPGQENTVKNARRIGLGTMGLAEYLFQKEIRYGSEKAIAEIEKLYKFIRDESYIASCELAKEKGAFPKFDRVQYCNASFIRKLPPKLRMLIKESTIRNSTITTCPPTGTTSLIAEVNSGIEPLPFKGYRRVDGVGERIYIHPMCKDYYNADWFVDSYDLLPEEHLETQSTIQKYICSGVSKTILLPKTTKVEDLSTLLLEYIRDIKGVTVYRDESRKEQVYYKLSQKEITKLLKDSTISSKLDVTDTQCKSGMCEI